MKKVTLTLSDETIDQLNKIKKELGSSKSATVRIAIDKYFKEKIFLK